MPVLLSPIEDPSPRLMAGEHMRIGADALPAPPDVVLRAGTPAPTGFASLVVDEDAYPPMNSFVEGNRLRGVLQVRVNAGIAAPGGAWVPCDRGPLLWPALWASGLWVISGVTRDSAGATLGNCRVVVLDYGQLAVGQAQCVVAETVSDGSGNYSVPVPQNKQYEVISYLAGSPNLAGISDIVVPSSAP